MSHEGLAPPPPPPACLLRLYASSQKGGTWIAEKVTDLEKHNQIVAEDPGRYRPPCCPRCERPLPNIHSYRDRTLRASPGNPVVEIVRFRCRKCRGIWRVLPYFIARALWRSWTVVEAETIGPPPRETEPRVPRRTVRRWLCRLASSARALVQALATSGAEGLGPLRRLAGGLDPTREAAVLAHADACGAQARLRIAALAVFVHRVAPGLRVM